MMVRVRVLLPVAAAMVALGACSQSSGDGVTIEPVSTTVATSGRSGTPVVTVAAKPVTTVAKSATRNAELDAIDAELSALEHEADALDEAANASQENS